jgi:hypothetical protein
MILEEQFEKKIPVPLAAVFWLEFSDDVIA